MAHPYASKAKTGQQIAAARYTPVASTTPPMNAGPLIEAATQTSRVEKCNYDENGAPARQVSEDGKVKK
jgi:hypothetical protein